jgi:hypothetical protein
MYEHEKAEIRRLLPGVIERSRMGDQNATSLLTAIRRNASSNEKSRFSYETALDIVKTHPKRHDGFVTIGAETVEAVKTNPLFEKYTPLTIAIAIFPLAFCIDSAKLPKEVQYYLESLTQLENDDFSRFPLLAYEFGE